MKQYVVNTTFLFWFRSKSIIRKLSNSVESCFSDRPFFLSKNIETLRNLNHYKHVMRPRKSFRQSRTKNYETLDDFNIGSIRTQVKWYLISSTRNIVYRWLHDLLNLLRLRTLENQEIMGTSQKWQETEPSTLSFFCR